MENHHISITQQTLAWMELKPGDRVLDLGCGAGWASRLMAGAVANGDKLGQVIGLDVSDEMIRRATLDPAQHQMLDRIEADHSAGYRLSDPGQHIVWTKHLHQAQDLDELPLARLAHARLEQPAQSRELFR